LAHQHQPHRNPRHCQRHRLARRMNVIHATRGANRIDVRELNWRKETVSYPCFSGAGPFLTTWPGYSMSDVVSAKIVCEGCNKTYAWKPELAGKKVKCKCGTVIHVPQAAAPKEEPEDLYDLAPSEEAVKPKKRLPIAPAAAAATGVAVATNSAAVGYESAPTRRDRMSSENLMDMKRDVHVPVA